MPFLYILSLLIVAATFAVSYFLYPQLPEQMASHWNSMNEVDGYLTKFWGAYLMPLIGLGLIALFYFLPFIDPLRKNLEKFRSFYDGFVILFVVFFAYIHALTLAWNLGYVFNVGQMILPSIGVIFLYVSVLLKHAKRNWFVGIRTPWTLSDDVVWDKTHALGSRFFFISALFAFAGFLFSEYALWLVVAPVIALSVFLLVYSYVVYRGRH